MFEKSQVLELKFILKADRADFLTLYYIHHKIKASGILEDVNRNTDCVASGNSVNSLPDYNAKALWEAVK